MVLQCHFSQGNIASLWVMHFIGCFFETDTTTVRLHHPVDKKN